MTQSSDLIYTQIGVESTPGTGVAATKKFTAMSIETQIDAAIQTFTAKGSMVPTAVYNQRGDRVTASVSGLPTYTEMMYPLASIIGAPTTTQPDNSGSPDVYQHVFTPAVNDSDTPKSYTVETVGPDRSFKFAYGVFNAFGFTVTRSGGSSDCSITGSMLGKALEDGITKTASSGVTALDPIIMTPLQWCLYIDDAAEDLGETKFDEAFQVVWDHPQKYVPYESVDCGTSTFTKLTQQMYAQTLAITFERNGDASAFLSSMRSGDKKFIQLVATGPAIDETYDHKMTFDFCGAITTPNLGETDKVATVTYTFTNLYDPTWDKAMEITLINDVATL